jgi:hypothetical protein
MNFVHQVFWLADQYTLIRLGNEQNKNRILSNFNSILISANLMKHTNEYLLRSTSDGMRLSSLHSMGLPIRCVLRYFKREKTYK